MNMTKCALQISKGAAQRGRTEEAVQPVRRSAPEHNPSMTSKHHSQMDKTGSQFYLFYFNYNSSNI